MQKLTYRPEIDGLRAIAVIAVVLYHAGFSSFSGGYAGVDVFFVISGYLITSLILKEVHETGTFQFGRFYLRRIRRLFPALFATTLVSALCAFLFFSPAKMEDFGASALATLASVSNFYFWFEADYFDAAATTKPLLHTWSLSVEEQFYLIWPAILVFGLSRLPRAVVLPIVGLLALGSLAFAEYWLAIDRDAAFYLLPARILEMAMGAALVWLPNDRKVPQAVSEAGALLGLGMIGWALMTYTHHTPFPGVSVLVPCVGTALVIWCTKARFAGAVLRLAPAVWTGKISYSMYLVHWPVVVIYMQLIEPQPTTLGKVLMVGLAFGLGWLQYQFVESRFRHPQPGREMRFGMGLGAAATGFAAFAMLAWTSNGMTWRIPETRLAKSDREHRALVKTTYCRSFAPAGTFAGDNRDLVTCQNYRGKKNDIYIMGDSHALHLAAGFARVYPAYNVHVLYQNGCDPQSGFAGYVRKLDDQQTADCVARNRNAIAKLSQTEPTNIIITSAKRSLPKRIAPATKELLGPLKDAGHQVSVLADFIRPGRSLSNCRQVPAYVVSDQDLKALCSGMSAASHAELRYNRDLKRRLPELVDVNDLQCSDEACMFYRRGKLLFRDAHHLNPHGSEIFVRMLYDRLPIQKNGRSAGPKTVMLDK